MAEGFVSISGSIDYRLSSIVSVIAASLFSPSSGQPLPSSQKEDNCTPFIKPSSSYVPHLKNKSKSSLTDRDKAGKADSNAPVSCFIKRRAEGKHKADKPKPLE